MNQQVIPEGYLENSAGHLVPKETISEIDILRDELVKEIVEKARKLQEAMRDFKMSVMGDVAAFVEMSADKYNVKVGGTKGNVTLSTFDGNFKVQRAVAEDITFDERLQAAKALIDQCIHRWAEGSAAEIRALVEHAFQVDKEGKISTGRVLGLRRLSISDPQWQEAMMAIADSIQISGSKTYFRIYVREGNSDRMTQIALDLAAI